MTTPTRLHDALARLYGPLPDAGPGTARACVLELPASAGWEPVAALCRGLQAELGLPLPGLAVSGRDGLQVWLSLQRAVPRERLQRMVQALCSRYLAAVPAARLRVFGLADGQPLPEVPAPVADERWSAFVAPDLMPLFVDTPWLDTEPGDDAQARLLAALEPLAPAAFDDACAALGLADVAPAAALTPPDALAAVTPPDALAALAPPDALAAGDGIGGPDGLEGPTDRPPGATATRWQDPRDFLRAVMNDARAPLALRIEAAKALLPGASADGGAPPR